MKADDPVPVSYYYTHTDTLEDLLFYFFFSFCFSLFCYVFGSAYVFGSIKYAYAYRIVTISVWHMFFSVRTMKNKIHFVWTEHILNFTRSNLVWFCVCLKYNFGVMVN